MAKQRKIVDYSRFHEVFINMSPSQQWFDEWGEDAIACNDNIKDFPYFKRIENDITFFKQVEGMKYSLERKKKDIEATIKEYSGIRDENIEERLKQCNKCLDMEINNYEKLEYLKFICSNIDYLRREEILEYEQECKTVRNAITSIFITRGLRKNKTFDFFCKQRNIFIQALYYWFFAVLIWMGTRTFWMTGPGFTLYFALHEGFIPYWDFYIPFLLIGIVLPGIIAFTIGGLPFLFIYMKVFELESNFINTKLLFLDEINPDDSFKENSKEVLKTGLKIGILSKILFRK